VVLSPIIGGLVGYGSSMKIWKQHEDMEAA